MRLRECDGCEDTIAEHDLARSAGRTWVGLSDTHGWQADACSAACADLAVVRS